MPNTFNILDRPQTAALDADGLPPDISVETWAALQAIPVGRRVVGRRYGVRQPVCANGTHGTIWTWTGALFSPAGQQLVFSSNALVTNGAGPSTTEWIARSTMFAIGVLAGVRLLKSSTRFDRSVVDPNVATLRDRLGLTGTATDQQLGSNQAGGADRQTQYVNRFSPISDAEIAARGLSPGESLSLDTRGGNAAAPNANIALANALFTSALYYSVTYQQGATPAATISSPYCFIWVE